MNTFVKIYISEDAAINAARLMTRAARDGSIYCVVDGPEDNWAVVDLATAIELGGGYRWWSRGLSRSTRKETQP